MNNDYPKHDYPALKLSEMSGKQYIVWGFVSSVNPETQMMKVKLPEFDEETPDIPINNMTSVRGVGFRVMPVAKHTIVILMKVGNRIFQIL